MTDEQFAQKMSELDENHDLAGMREMLKPAGQLSRLIALAVRGATRAKRSTTKAPETFVHDDFPGPQDREHAIAYWRKHGRQDLEPRVEEQIDKFRSHFADKKAASWSGRWRTWYMNAIDYTRPSPGSVPAAVIFRQAPISEWVIRLAMFYGYDEEVPKGTWNATWGPRPSEKNNKVPSDANTEFLKRYRQSA